jgi:hypothetical protein
MFNLFHKLYANVLLTKPSVHYIQPKALNVYFKNSIAPQYFQINLNNYDRFDIEIEKEDQEKTNIFNLLLNLYQQGQIETIKVASFETRKEAELAATILRNKLYSPGKVLFKALFVFLVLFFIWNMLIGALPRPATPVASMSYPPIANLSGTNPASPGIDTSAQKAQLAQMENEAYQRAQASAAAQVQQIQSQTPAQPAQAQAPAAPEVSQDPNVQSFMNKLDGK